MFQALFVKSYIQHLSNASSAAVTFAPAQQASVPEVTAQRVDFKSVSGIWPGRVQVSPFPDRLVTVILTLDPLTSVALRMPRQDKLWLRELFPEHKEGEDQLGLKGHLSSIS